MTRDQHLRILNLMAKWNTLTEATTDDLFVVVIAAAAMSAQWRGQAQRAGVDPEALRLAVQKGYHIGLNLSAVAAELEGNPLMRDPPVVCIEEASAAIAKARS